MTNSHKNIINPLLESSTLLIMTFPEIVESKDLLCGRTCAVDNVRARRKGVLGKLYEIQISPERGLRNSLKFPSYFGMEYVRPWNMGKKLLDKWPFSMAMLVYQRVFDGLPSGAISRDTPNSSYVAQVTW